jgi:hypothetical protein
MEEYDTVVAVFVDHQQAEAAVKKLATIGFDNRHISVVGKVYHDDAKFGGFYGAGDRIKFWGELERYPIKLHRNRMRRSSSCTLAA